MRVNLSDKDGCKKMTSIEQKFTVEYYNNILLLLVATFMIDDYNKNVEYFGSDIVYFCFRIVKNSTYYKMLYKILAAEAQYQDLWVRRERKVC